MQDARDSFYVALRNAVATINPGRTTVIRGQVRPGVLVEENEMPMAEEIDDTFILRWGAVTVSPEAATSIAKLDCSVLYGTRGAAPLSGGVVAAGVLGRGRALVAMDTELLKALQPGTCEKLGYAAMSITGAMVGPSGIATPATAPVDRGSKLWWGEPQFGKEADADGRVSRVATLSIWAVVG